MAISNLTATTLDELTDLAIAFYSNLLPEDDVSRMSDQWKRVRAMSMLISDLQFGLTIVERDALPDTAIKVALDRWGVVLELPRKGATPARGTDALRVRGTVGAVVSTSYTLAHKTGLRYRVNESGTIPAGGFLDVDVVAIDTGAATRLSKGEILTFEDAFTGLQTNAELVAALDQDGVDTEADGPYRVRQLKAIRRPELGGTESDWERRALEVDGVSVAFVYPNRDGLGTVDIVGMHAGSGTSRSLTAGERTELLAHLDERRPVSAIVRVLETIGQNADVQVVFDPLPDAAFRPDWADPGNLTVSAWNSSTRVLTLSAARPASMAAGQRVVVKAGKAEVMTIESLGPGANEIKIATPIPSGWTPASPNPVYPGGPITKPLRDAIIAWIDSLGPAVGDFGTGWSGALYYSDVFALAQEADGVLDSEVLKLDGSTFVTLTPTEFLFPDDAKIGFLVPNMILIRYAT
jgi:Uncharacterized homolog of phage Mu protein gp47